MGSPAGRFKQEITYASPTGRDSYGKPTMGAKSTARARVQPTRKLIRDPQGNEHVSSHVVYTAAPIGLTHRLWLDGADTTDFNQARRVIGLDVLVDGDGREVYRKVWL